MKQRIGVCLSLCMIGSIAHATNQSQIDVKLFIQATQTWSLTRTAWTTLIDGTHRTNQSSVQLGVVWPIGASYSLYNNDWSLVMTGAIGNTWIDLVDRSFVWWDNTQRYYAVFGSYRTDTITVQQDIQAPQSPGQSPTTHITSTDHLHIQWPIYGDDRIGLSYYEVTIRYPDGSLLTTVATEQQELYIGMQGKSTWSYMIAITAYDRLGNASASDTYYVPYESPNDVNTSPETPKTVTGSARKPWSKKSTPETPSASPVSQDTPSAPVSSATADAHTPPKTAHASRQPSRTIYESSVTSHQSLDDHKKKPPSYIDARQIDAIISIASAEDGNVIQAYHPAPGESSQELPLRTAAPTSCGRPYYLWMIAQCTVYLYVVYRSLFVPLFVRSETSSQKSHPKFDR